MGKRQPEPFVGIATTTWDAIDIIEPFLRHYERLGVRQIVVIDYHSTDGTREVLQSARWRELVEMVDLSSLSADVYTELLSIAQSRFGSEWCLLCDPDEFLVTPSMSVNDLLPAPDDGDVAVVTTSRRNMTTLRSVAAGPGTQLSPYTDLDLRIDRPTAHPLADHTDETMTQPWIFGGDEPKVAIQPSRIRTLLPGFHGAEADLGAGWQVSAGCLLLHYPFRSYSQFEHKVSQAIEHGAAEWPPPTGWQYRRWIACRERGTLFAEYLEQFIADEDVAGLLATGTLIRDTRVRDLAHGRVARAYGRLVKSRST